MKPKALALVGFFALGSSLLQAQSPTPVPLTMPGNPATDVKVVPDPYLNSGRTENQPPTSTTATIQQTVPMADSNSLFPLSASDNLVYEPSRESLWTRSNMTGNWGGLRPTLQESGITFGGNLTQFYFGVNGGVQRPVLPALRLGDTSAYTGRGEYEMKFDLEKFGGLPKGSLLIRAQHWFGEYANITPSVGSLSPAIFAAAIPPQPNDRGTPFITDFVLTQPLSKNLVVFAGKKNVLGVADQDEFAGGNGTSQFLNQGLVANPAFLLGLPYSSFSAGVVSPQEWGSVSTFIYDPQDRTKDFFRLDDLFSQGVIIGGEVKVKSKFFGLPGDQHIGGMWKHVALTDLRFNQATPGVYPEPVVPGFSTLNNSFTIYSGFDQYLQVYSEESKRGWGLFGRASISDGNPTPVRYFLSAGLGGYSPFAHERGDTFGAGFYYVGASNEFGPRPRAVVGPRDGWGLELYYNVQVTPWMNLTPDFQIIEPEAGRIAKTAYIGGVRLNMRF